LVEKSIAASAGWGRRKVSGMDILEWRGNDEGGLA
jgi:hypothetical protein